MQCSFSCSIGFLCLSLKSERLNCWPLAGHEDRVFNFFFPFMTLISTTSEVKLRGFHGFTQK